MRADGEVLGDAVVVAELQVAEGAPEEDVGLVGVGVLVGVRLELDHRTVDDAAGGVATLQLEVHLGVVAEVEARLRAALALPLVACENVELCEAPDGEVQPTAGSQRGRRLGRERRGREGERRAEGRARQEAGGNLRERAVHGWSPAGFPAIVGSAEPPAPPLGAHHRSSLGRRGGDATASARLPPIGAGRLGRSRRMPAPGRRQGRPAVVRTSRREWAWRA